MSIRTERVASVIKQDLSRILLQYQNNNMITITEVKMTPDLSIAKVYLSVIDPVGSEDSVYELVQANATSIRHELAALVRHQLRKVPELQFYKDDTAQYASKMENLFRKVKDERPEDNED